MGAGQRKIKQVEGLTEKVDDIRNAKERAWWKVNGLVNISKIITQQ